MKTGFKMGDKASAQLICNPTLGDVFKFGGVFIAEHYRAGEKIGETWGKNIVPNQAVYHALDVIMDSTNNQVVKWYCIVFKTDTTPTAGMGYVAPTYTEVNAMISNTYRPEYVDIRSAGSVTNAATKAAFTFTGTGGSITIDGAAVVGVSADDANSKAKGNTTAGGIILASSKFASSRVVEDDDIINLTYVFSGADDGA